MRVGSDYLSRVDLSSPVMCTSWLEMLPCTRKKRGKPGIDPGEPERVSSTGFNSPRAWPISRVKQVTMSPIPAFMHIPIRSIQLFLFAASFGWAGQGLAWQVANRVVIEHGALVIDHSKTIAEITRAQASGGFPAEFSAEYGLGLFQNRFTTELTFTPPEPGAKTQRLSMTTRIKTAPIIYVAKEFPEDSCAYGVVLGHERLHQLFDRDVLRKLPGEIRAITQTVFDVDVLEWEGTRNLERARARFFQQVKYVYDGLSLPMHQTIDNPESYRRLGGQCNGEIAKRLAGTTPGA